ncbi:NUDIX domain-containing protein [Hypoxylon cercidicola]|nr:NUDIX domain-containing protein [Hypoxylon cercidicola]
MASPPKTYLDLVKACDNFFFTDISYTAYPEFPDPEFYQLLLPGDSRPHGILHQSVVAKMPWTSDFEVSSADVQPRTVRVLDSSDGRDTAHACNAALLGVVQKAAEAGTFTSLSHQRLTEDLRTPGAKYPLDRLQRAVAGLFGITRRNAHMTMYTRTPEGEIKIWLPFRSAHLRTYPGKINSTVVGDIKADESPFECIIHRADLKASIPKCLVRQHAKSCGAITCTCTSDAGSGYETGILYVYDMEADHTVMPKPQNNEVEEFNLWGVQQIKEALFRGEFKSNCASVMVDFFVRHGIITNENEPDYLEIVSRLHRTLAVPTSVN